MDTDKIADLLLRLRKEKGLTQAEVAERFHISNKSVSKWERGETMPDVSLLTEIAEFYGITVDELLKGELVGRNISPPAPLRERRPSEEELARLRALQIRYRRFWLVNAALVLLGIAAFAVCANFWGGTVNLVLAFAVPALSTLLHIIVYARQSAALSKLPQSAAKPLRKRRTIFFLSQLSVASLVFVALQPAIGAFSDVGSYASALLFTVLLFAAIFVYVLGRGTAFFRFAARRKTAAILFAAVTAGLCFTLPFFNMQAEMLHSSGNSFTLPVNFWNAMAKIVETRAWLAAAAIVVLLAAVAMLVVAVWKDLPSWIVFAAWSATACLMIFVCNAAYDEYAELYRRAGYAVTRAYSPLALLFIVYSLLITLVSVFFRWAEQKRAVSD